MTTVISGSSPSITFSDATTQTTAFQNSATLSVNAQNTFGFKNRIINGGMVIDQRNAGAAWGTSINGYAIDRWALYQSVTGKLNGSQNYNSVSLPNGFTNYAGMQSQSAYSVGASDYYLFQQQIEGFNVADLGWGTANAKTVTLSFVVQSSLIGTFGGAIQNNSTNRSYPFSYSIPVANTWTTISITIAGDTSGTWLTTNGSGMTVRFGLGIGSTFSGTAGSWSGSNYFSATGATSVVGTTNATFYITGVQLEVGTQATSFDFRDYGSELILCQRYYWKSISTGSGQTRISMGLAYSTTQTSQHAVMYPVEMRATPTINSLSGNNIYNPVIGGKTITSLVTEGASSSGTSLVTGGSTALIAQNNWSVFNGTIEFSSEL